MDDTRPKNFFRSFRYAWRGVSYAFRNELSFRVQVVIGALVVVLSLFLPLSQLERVVLYVLVALVLILEIINTIFERVVDALQPRIHPVAAAVKDMMAAAVLIAAVASVVVGLIILIPAAVALFA